MKRAMLFFVVFALILFSTAYAESAAENTFPCMDIVNSLIDIHNAMFGDVFILKPEGDDMGMRNDFDDRVYSFYDSEFHNMYSFYASQDGKGISSICLDSSTLDQAMLGLFSAIAFMSPYMRSGEDAANVLGEARDRITYVLDNFDAICTEEGTISDDEISVAQGTTLRFEYPRNPSKIIDPNQSVQVSVIIDFDEPLTMDILNGIPSTMDVLSILNNIH